MKSTTTQLWAVAACRECRWRKDGRGAQSATAEHHQSTGHECFVTAQTRTTYAHEPSPEELGQTTIDDHLGTT